MEFLKFTHLNRPDSVPVLDIFLCIYMYYGNMKGGCNAYRFTSITSKCIHTLSLDIQMPQLLSFSDPVKSNEESLYFLKNDIN